MKITDFFSSWELILSGILFVLFVIIFTLEVIAPASKNKCDKRWFVISLGLNGVTSSLSVILVYIFSKEYNGYSLFTTRKILSDGLVIAIAFLLGSFVFYWWHRMIHHVNFLWRFFHQLHHAPQRIESLTAFYVHPFDATATVIINFSICHFILGASPFVYFIELLIAGILSLLLHADLKTPYWLGYFIQRPEMHTIHHQKNVHAYNYAAFSFWDLLFGTWKNPRERVKDVGFDDTKSNMIFEMLICKDVHKISK